MAVNVNGGPLEFDAVINNAQFRAQIDAIERSLKGLTATAERESKSINGLVRTATAALASYATFSAAGNFISDIIRVRGEFQQLEVAFRVMLGSKAEADKLLAEQVALAIKTPFTLQEVATGAKQLLAYSFSVDEVTDTLKVLGNVSAGVGAPLGDIVYLFGTLKTQGRAFTKDITQFTSRGIPIIAELAKQFGVAESEIFGMVEAGKVGFPEVERAFKSMTSQGGLFFNLMEEQSKTLTGQISNLKDAWQLMLNDIGKSQEGTFSGAISVATSLVKNYQKVLDILKVLVLTYGTYKAALIASTALTKVYDVATRSLSITQTLQATAATIAARANDLLNKTLLANPFALVASALVGLIAAFKIFGREVSLAEKQQKTLADITDEAAEATEKEKQTLQQLIAIVKDETASKADKEAAMRKINSLSPEYLANITQEEIRTGKATAAIDEYIKALDRRALATAAENEIARLATEQRKAQTEVLRLQGRGADKLPLISSRDAALEHARYKAAVSAVEEYGQTIEKVKNTYGDELKSKLIGEPKKQGATLRTIAVIDEEIKVLREEQRTRSDTAEKRINYDKQINKLEKERAAIAGDKKADKAFARETNERLEELQRLRELITEAEIDANRSGLLKEESALDRINERYDDLRNKARELKAGESDFKRIEAARTIQLGNERVKQELEIFKKGIDDQKAVFDRFEEYKLQFGIEQAQKLMGSETGAAIDYLDFLHLEIEKLQDDRSKAADQKRLDISDAYLKAEKEKREREVALQAEQYAQLLEETQTYNVARAAINKKYNALEKTLDNNRGLPDFDARKKLLQQNRADELKELDNHLLRQSDLYRKLNEDIIGFSRAQLKTRANDLRKILEKDLSLTPEMRAAIISYIEQIQNLFDETSQGALDNIKLQKTARQIGEIASGMSHAAGAVRELNVDLADSLETMSRLTDAAASAVSAIGSFKLGTTEGNVSGIGSVISSISSIVSAIGPAIQSKKVAEKAILDFQTRLMVGEHEMNEILRERAREQVKLNKLKLDGLKDERKLLQEQAAIAKKQYEDIFKQLQGETFVTGLKKKGPGLGTLLLGGLAGNLNTRTKEIRESLVGKTFEELEKLFISDQLTGKAKELFIQLQKIKQEGADIDALLAENARAFREALTGTTADSIVDSIVAGFSEGKRSAADFAQSFEDLMRNAVLQSLKFQALEKPLQKFYDEFAADAESGSMLTEEEIRKLRENFNSIIGDAGKKFEELQKITNVNFQPGTNGGNALSGTIKSITEETGNLLAGQIGGMRLTVLDQLKIATSSLTVLQGIEANSARLLSKFDAYETGLKKLRVEM